jgi:hypothetical protein
VPIALSIAVSISEIDVFQRGISRTHQSTFNRLVIMTIDLTRIMGYFLAKQRHQLFAQLAELHSCFINLGKTFTRQLILDRKFS